MTWRVTGPVAVVIIEGSARYLDCGTVFGAGENVEHLVSIGLVEPVEAVEAVPDAEPEPSPDAEVKPARRTTKQ